MLDVNEVLIDRIASGFYKETHGQNRSPILDKLCLKWGYPLGSPWCALFVIDAFDLIEDEHKEISGIKIIKTAGSQAMLKWFKDRALISKNPQDLLNWKGALAIRTDPGGKHGHVLLISERLTTNNKVVALTTLEGNTNLAGSSNGDGAYKRKRIIPLTPYTWTFCNTSEIIGGRWWN